MQQGAKIVIEFAKPVYFVTDLLYKFLGLQSSKEKEILQRVIEYIETCVEHMENIMGMNSSNQTQVEYSRKFLQGAYQEMPIHLNELAKPVECDIIKKSLMSARIYYHAVKEGEVRDEDLKIDYQERLSTYRNNVYDQKMFRQNSYEQFLYDMVMHGRKIDKNNPNYSLQKILEVCREDVAKINLLKERLKSRKARR